MNNMPLLATLALDSLGVAYKERDCIVCHKKFIQRMKVNKQGKPVGGKSTVIMPGGTYVIDENFNPPRATKIEDNEEENGRRK